MFKRFKRRGQVAVLYALIIPVFLTFAGVGLDLGWYYLNVSRLQNAADAAVVAGALEFVNSTDEQKKDTAFENIVGYKLVNNFPLDEEKKYKVTEDAEDEETAAVAQKETALINDADATAASYALKNLGAASGNSIIDNWSKSKLEAKRLVTPNYSLYNYDGNFYYAVTLTEKIEHLFMPGWTEMFFDMDAPVKAVVMLNLKEVVVPLEIVPPIKELEATQVIADNWEVEASKSRKSWQDPTSMSDEDNPYKDNYFVKKTTNAYQGVWYNYNSQSNKNMTTYQLSTVTVKPGSQQDGGSTSKKNQDNIANGIDYSKGSDSLTLGFRQDIVCVKNQSEGRGNKDVLYLKEDGTPALTSGGTTGDRNTDPWFFESDWDLRYQPPNSVYDKMLDVMYINQGSRDGTLRIWNESRDKRIHNCYNFDTPFEDRYKETPESGEADILYGRIESEAFIDIRYLGVTDRGKIGQQPSHFEYKSVRQIILNMNASNFDTATKKYRPICLFYMGPERYDMNSTIRASQPVILNINADFRGILYAPFSPVVVNVKSGCKFEGFVVAKEYHKLKQSGAQKINDAAHGNVDMWIDEYGNVQTEKISLTKVGEYSHFNHPGFKGYNSAGEGGANMFVSDSNTTLY